MNEAKRPPELHGSRPCRSCPFRVDLEGKCFLPDVLDATIGENLRRQEHVHRCHNEKPGAERQRLCVGFMRFLEATRTPNNLYRMGQRLGVIDPSAFDRSVPIIEDWDDVLANHAATMEAAR